MTLLTVGCIAAYLFGSISSAVLVCRLAGKADPRTEGSKNPGATNVLRLGGKKLAAFTFLGDALKGALPVLAAKLYQPDPLFVGPILIAAYIGHLYPIFFRFRGGKGIAILIGLLSALSWPVGSALIATWLGTFALFRISSLSGLVMASCAPFYVLFSLGLHYALATLLMTLLTVWRHRENIARLRSGNEK